MREDAIRLSLELEGFRVIGTDETADEVEVAVALKIPGGVCPECSGVSTTVYQRTVVRVRDVPLKGKPTYLRWHKRRFRCERPTCTRRTFTETHPEIPARARGTHRFQAHLAACGRRRPIAHVAEEEQTSWWRVWRAVEQQADRGSAELGTVRRLGIDEAAFRRGARYHTAFVDIDRGRLLDLVKDRTKRSVTDWLLARDSEWRDAIVEVAIDAFVPYLQGVREALPSAQVVMDKFHAIRLAGEALDAVRRRVQREATKKKRHRRSRNPDPSRWATQIYAVRRKLTKARERLDDREQARLEAAFEADPTGDLRAAWALKEAFRDWYLAPTRALAEQWLGRWYEAVEMMDIAEFLPLAETIRAWESELLAHFGSGATNAATEGITNMVKVVKRDAFGFRNFKNFRMRVLYRCG